METPVVTWMIDSGKRESIHRNVPGLTAAQSYMGHLERRKDVDGDWSWGYVINGTYHMAANYAQAHKKLKEAVMALLPREDTDPCGKCSHPFHRGLCKRAMSCNCEG